MFSRSRADGFTLYSRRRSRWAPPRWLLLLLFGVVAGAAGLWWVQERHLPPRLSAVESAQRLAAQQQAESESRRLAGELAQTQQALQAAETERQTLRRSLRDERESTERLRADLAAVVSALPPDPRQGAVEVRAARFEVDGGELEYKLVLTRERGGGRPLAGVVQLVLTGAPLPAGGTSLELRPIATMLSAQEVLHGRLPLPAGFRPEHTTVRVLDSKAGTVLGTRMLVVR